MSSWSPQRVLDAAAAMEFVPESAIEVRTGDYRLVRHPDWVLGPAVGAAQVTWSRTARPLDEVIDEVAARVLARELDEEPPRVRGLRRGTVLLAPGNVRC